MEPRDFFLELLRRKGLTTTGLARVLRESGKTDTNIQPNLNKWLNDPAKEPEVKTMLPVAEFFGVNLGAFYRPKEARDELRRLDGLGRTDERQSSVTNVTPITDLRGQPFPDALHPEQRRVVNEVTALLVGTFTRWNRPPTGLDRGRWSASRSGKKGGGKRPPKDKKG